MRRPTRKTVIVLLAAVTAVAISSSVAKAQPPITEFPVPTTSSTPTTIVVGPDGNLWFTEQGADKIGRITPTGVVTEFTVPPPGSFPVGIAAGPDGNLWFTLAVGNQIGRITPAGVV